ncbi:MAG: HAMP domain-containing sensor histidine kinase [Spirochaetaceae bacterium]|nr:HAMP domain-containing sensor histidine kinase [Spirochaetaceae bacterium]
MRTYALLFMLLVFGVIIVVTYAGMESVIFALQFYAETSIDEPLVSATARIRAAYEAAEGASRLALEEAGGLIDEARSQLSRGSILRDRIYARLSFNLVSVGFICVAASLAVWLGLYRLFLRPLDSMVKVLSSAAAANWRASVPTGGFREIRVLQSTLNTMMAEIRVSHERLRDMERMSVARFMAHQIKNALTPIRLCAYNVGALCEGGDVRANIDLVVQGTDKIERLIEQFRILSQFPDLVRSSVELDALIRGLLRPLTGVSYAGPSSSVVVEADPVLLEEAIMNLIRNALESGTTEPVAIVLRGGRPPILSIEDRGCGMDAATQAMMFDESFTTKQKGMGIGLAFVKKVLDAHGFGIRFESEPGRGTKAEVLFGR